MTGVDLERAIAEDEDKRDLEPHWTRAQLVIPRPRQSAHQAVAAARHFARARIRVPDWSRRPPCGSGDAAARRAAGPESRRKFRLQPEIRRRPAPRRRKPRKFPAGSQPSRGETRLGPTPAAITSCEFPEFRTISWPLGEFPQPRGCATMRHFRALCALRPSRCRRSPFRPHPSSFAGFAGLRCRKDAPPDASATGRALGSGWSLSSIFVRGIGPALTAAVSPARSRLVSHLEQHPIRRDHRLVSPYG